MQHGITRFAVLSLFVLSAAACDDDATGPGQQVAQLRVVNAATVADVQVRRVGGVVPLAQDLDFQQFTQSCVEVPAGEQALIFSASGVELATTAATFEPDQRYTAFLLASGPTRRAFVVPDNEIASAGNNAIRLVNATSAAGDVYVTPPGGAVSASFLVFGNMPTMAGSNLLPSYFHRAVEHTQVRLFNTGTTTGTPRADLTLSGLPATRLVTVVFTDPGPAGAPTAFMVTPCP